MDSEEESPKSGSLDEGDAGRETSPKTPRLEEIWAGSSGEIASEGVQNILGATESGIADSDAAGFENSVGADVFRPTVGKNVKAETEISGNSSQSPPSVNAAVESALPVLKKGSGLRKWRRMKRDLNKNESGSADSGQILKRRFNNTEASKSREESKVKSKAVTEGGELVASAGSRNAEISPLVVGTGLLDPELEHLANSGFSIGMESDNSEDHSSKSSTAASVPRHKHESNRIVRDRGRGKIFGGKGSTPLGFLNVHQGKGGTVDSSKKIRGDLARFEKENSLSSVESDLRSSAVGNVQWGSVVDSNGRLDGRSLKFDEQSDEAHTGEEVHSGYYKDSKKAESLFKDGLDGKVLEERNPKSEKCMTSSDLDPCMKSMASLQEAQEVLEKEIQKLGTARKEQDNNVLLEEMDVSSSLTLKAHLTDLKQTVEALESKLEEASTTIKSKEQKLSELESLLGDTHSPKMEFLSTYLSPIQQREQEATSELEVLLKEKMEAEIEFFILTGSTQNWKTLSEHHRTLLKEQMILACEQEQMMIKLRDAEEKTVKLREQTDKLEECCKELLGMENVLRLQNKVCMFSLCFIVQLMLLFVALGPFLVHLLSPDDGVAPT